MQIRLSFSARQTFKMCPRKYYYRYVAGIECVKKDMAALIIGKSFHAGLERYRQSRDIKSSLATMTATFCNESGQPTEFCVIDMIKLEAYLLGYITKYHSSDSDVAWETELRLGDDDDIGYIDAAKVVDGRYHFVEDKTRATLTTDLNVLLRTNEQVIHYAYLAANAGLDVASIELRETQKTRLTVRQKETVDDYRKRLLADYMAPGSDKYQSAKITYTTKHIIDYIRELKTTDDIIHGIVDKNLPLFLWPRNSYQCNGVYGKCEFLPICACCPHANAGFVARSNFEPLDSGVFQRGFLTKENSDGDNTSGAAILSDTEF